MNMVGNMGAAVSAVAFPFFVANVTVPVIAETTGTANSFFLFAAGMNVLAVIAWIFMNPLRQLKQISASALKLRLVLFLMMFVLVITALVYTKFLYEPEKVGSRPRKRGIASRNVSEQVIRHHSTSLALGVVMQGSSGRCEDRCIVAGTSIHPPLGRAERSEGRAGHWISRGTLPGPKRADPSRRRVKDSGTTSSLGEIGRSAVIAELAVWKCLLSPGCDGSETPA